MRTLIERPFNIIELPKTTYHHIVSAFLIAHTLTRSRFQKKSLLLFLAPDPLLQDDQVKVSNRLSRSKRAGER